MSRATKSAKRCASKRSVERVGRRFKWNPPQLHLLFNLVKNDSIACQYTRGLRGALDDFRMKTGRFRYPAKSAGAMMSAWTLALNRARYQSRRAFSANVPGSWPSRICSMPDFTSRNDSR